METEEIKFRKQVLDLMKGSLDLGKNNIPEGKLITNEFEEGKFCALAYEEVYNANRHLCEQLGVEECREVERIIDNLISISDYLCLKMYNYGAYFSALSQRIS